MGIIVSEKKIFYTKFTLSFFFCTSKENHFLEKYFLKFFQNLNFLKKKFASHFFSHAQHLTTTLVVFVCWSWNHRNCLLNLFRNFFRIVKLDPRIALWTHFRCSDVNISLMVASLVGWRTTNSRSEMYCNSFRHFQKI